MFRCSRALRILPVFAAFLAARAQAPVPPTAALAGAWQEPTVIGQISTAEFFLFFSPGSGAPKVENVQFISGSEKLKPAEDVLYDTNFPVAFPQGSSAHLARRAVVNCSGVSGCQAVLLNPSSVTSVK